MKSRLGYTYLTNTQQYEQANPGNPCETGHSGENQGEIKQ